MYIISVCKSVCAHISACVQSMECNTNGRIKEFFLRINSLGIKIYKMWKNCNTMYFYELSVSSEKYC